MQFQDWQFDKRVLRRNVRRNIITPQDYRQYLEALPDVADNVATPDDADDEVAGAAPAATDEQPAEAAAPSEAEEPEEGTVAPTGEMPETIPPPPETDGASYD
jgi:hypothetical protein